MPPASADEAPLEAARPPVDMLPHMDTRENVPAADDLPVLRGQPNLPNVSDVPDVTVMHELRDLADMPDEENGPVLLLCGVGPVAHAVALLAEQAHFVVDIVDINPELVAEEHFPTARQRFVLPDFNNLAQHCDIGLQHYVAILTLHPLHSEVLLHQALHTQARYIGLSGSREQRAPLFSRLREQGMPTTELACVRCPIGLPIGAQSSQEKAIAIVAELIAAREGCLPRAPKAEIV